MLVVRRYTASHERYGCSDSLQLKNILQENVLMMQMFPTFPPFHEFHHFSLKIRTSFNWVEIGFHKDVVATIHVQKSQGLPQNYLGY